MPVVPNAVADRDCDADEPWGPWFQNTPAAVFAPVGARRPCFPRRRQDQ